MWPSRRTREPEPGWDLDRRLAELARVLEERLTAVKTYGSCRTCGEAEAQRGVQAQHLAV